MLKHISTQVKTCGRDFEGEGAWSQGNDVDPNLTEDREHPYTWYGLRHYDVLWFQYHFHSKVGSDCKICDSHLLRPVISLSGLAILVVTGLSLQVTDI